MEILSNLVTWVPPEQVLYIGLCVQRWSALYVWAYGRWLLRQVAALYSDDYVHCLMQWPLGTLKHPVGSVTWSGWCLQLCHLCIWLAANVCGIWCHMLHPIVYTHTLWGSEYAVMLLWQWDDQVIAHSIKLLWIKMGGLCLIQSGSTATVKGPAMPQ